MKNIYLSLILSVVIIQSANAQWTSSGGTTSSLDIIQIGSISTGYTPTSGNWGNLILNSQNYSSIAFHHSGNRVDFIRAGNGTIQLGYDGGWGLPNIGLPNGIWTAAGFVGIANPTPKLQLQVGNSTGVQTALGVYSEFTANQYFDGSNWLYMNNGYGSFMEMNSLDGGINFRTSPSGTAGATSNPVSRMFIANDGRIGIGTSAPGFLLDIKNTGSTTPGIGIGNGTGNYLLGVGITAANANEFGIYDINAGMARFTLNSNGNVGIGTTTPGDKLVVNGAIRTVVNSPTGYGSYGGGFVAFDQDNGGNNIFSLVRHSNNLSISAWDGIGFSTGVTTPSTSYRMYINPLGNVGIGTTSPSAPLTISRSGTNSGGDYSSLHIETTGSGNIYGPILYLNGTSGTNGRMWGLVSSGTYDAGATGAAGNFAIYDTNAGSRLVINSLGQVGIGTISPIGTLDVRGASFIGTPDFSIGSAGSMLQIDQGASSGNTYSRIRAFSNGGTAVDNLVLQSSGGNVGIGTPSPGSQLTVRNGNTGVSIEPGSASYFGTLAFNRESKTGTIFNSSGNAFQINNGGLDQNLHIQVYHGDGSLVTNNALVIAGTNGNVGIGTTDNATWQLANSTYKLAVEGKVIAEEVTVKLHADWPDYVFKPKYTLMPLTDVKSYIDKNQHLPDMPSAAQVEKDGLNLGEMNKLLLKKVEELTLYLIEKDKNEKEQKVIISDLQKQMTDQKDQLARLEKQLELILKKSQ